MLWIERHFAPPRRKVETFRLQSRNVSTDKYIRFHYHSGYVSTCKYIRFHLQVHTFLLSSAYVSTCVSHQCPLTKRHFTYIMKKYARQTLLALRSRLKSEHLFGRTLVFVLVTAKPCLSLTQNQRQTSVAVLAVLSDSHERDSPLALVFHDEKIFFESQGFAARRK